MNINVRYFALIKERMGKDGELLEVSENTTAGALLDGLARRFAWLAASRHALQVAVNHEFVPDNTPLHEGDEVALIPPVAGGAPCIRLCHEPLRYDEVIAAVSGPGQGGLVLFAGQVRDCNGGNTVSRLHYEAYDDMALKKMQDIVQRIEREFPQSRLAMVHRVGTLAVGELAVIIAASAPHRGEAFAACRAAIEAVKQEVPIWKKEFSQDGDAWLGLPKPLP